MNETLDKTGNPWYSVSATTNKTTEDQEFFVSILPGKAPISSVTYKPLAVCLVVATEEMGASSSLQGLHKQEYQCQQ